MDQIEIGKFSDKTKLETFSKEELIQRHQIMADEILRLVREIYQLRNQKIADDQLAFIVQEQIEELRNTVFGSSSERYKKSDKPKTQTPSKPRIKKPSERYPNIPIRKTVITVDPAPQCQCCGSVMTDSGMTEDSEQLTVIPRHFEIILQRRVKYRCSHCHGDIQTAPTPPRIKEGSVYSDEMILDVALSKYCDLIPIERYSAMASRAGLFDLPPHSLIELTHDLADFVSPAYELVKDEVLDDRVMRADETPHKMLEGSDIKSWYLWGFSTRTACYFECHDTRSGDVASDILINAKCEILVSDVYSGYGKAVRLANEVRAKENRSKIQNANCNAHARRYFFKARNSYTRDAEVYLDHYHEIYKIEDSIKGKGPPEILKARAEMKSRFEAMKAKAVEDLNKFPNGSKLATAMGYFLKNYDGFTLFLRHYDVPIDNNSQEGLLRSPVVGRKTWYGTHSERGARTAAILFSLVESCKLIDVNPREYFKNLVQDLLAGKKTHTPKEFKDLQKI
jgi:transposase